MLKVVVVMHALYGIFFLLLCGSQQMARSANESYIPIITTNHAYIQKIDRCMDRMRAIKSVLDRSYSTNLSCHNYHQSPQTALLHDHKQCAQWNEGHYWSAMELLFAAQLPKGSFNTFGDNYKKFGSNDFYDLYVSDHDRFLILHQWRLYDYDQFWRFIRNFPDYDDCICRVYHSALNTKTIKKQLSKKAFERLQVEHDSIKHKQSELKVRMSKQQAITRNCIQYCTQLEQVYQDSNDQEIPVHIKKRKDAFDYIKHQEIMFTTHSYELDNSVQQFLEQHARSKVPYQSFTGNQFQHVLHKEFVSIIQAVAHNPSQHNGLETLIVEMADIGRENNVHGFMNQACTIADFCWTVLDCGKAFVEGVAQGTCNMIHAILHPIETIQEVTFACKMIGNELGYLLYQCAQRCGSCFIAALTNDIKLYITLREKNGNDFDRWIARCDVLVASIGHQLKQMPVRTSIKEGTCFVTEGFLAGKCLQFGTRFLKDTHKHIASLARTASKNSFSCKVMLSAAENIRIDIARSATQSIIKNINNDYRSCDNNIISLSKNITNNKFNFKPPTLQHMYNRHAKDFSLFENWSKSSAEQFINILNNHINKHNPIKGTYRGTLEVFHFFDSETRCNVILDVNGNLIGGWKLSLDQVKYLMSSGAIK